MADCSGHLLAMLKVLEKDPESNAGICGSGFAYPIAIPLQGVWWLIWGVVARKGCGGSLVRGVVAH